jgi:hypothetical protein
VMATLRLDGDDFACDRIKKDLLMPEMVEVEHIRQRPRQSVKGVVDSAQVPVIFDESEDRTLIGKTVVHEVLLGPTRNDLQRDSRPIAAAALEPTEGTSASAAQANARQCVSLGSGLVDDLPQLVVVPPVGALVCNRDSYRTSNSGCGPVETAASNLDCV